jgi:hypothetical protein
LVWRRRSVIEKEKERRRGRRQDLQDFLERRVSFSVK